MGRFIAYFGPSLNIVTDNGKHFINRLMEHFNRLYGIIHYHPTAYYPQSQGSVERLNHLLKSYIKMYLDMFENWAEILPLAQYS